MEDIEDQVIECATTNVGKYFLLYNPCHPDDALLRYASSINDIGLNNNCQLKNKTKVLLLSDKTVAAHPTIGIIYVNRVMGNEIFWAPTHFLIPIEE